ncbi:hypothetical protein IPN35_01390 [Candidatus Peregrinibacteria bacterium]|nr:MAG: hypothetical protein IPN35_01390 [Candidatus Peregrinibacteria bacterium]
MEKFKYITLNQENRKLTGVLAAKDEKEARAKLHAMGLSVVFIEKTNEEIAEEETGSMSFYFHVVDVKGKETAGTINAKSRETAYIRLISEYGFRVISLCETSVPEQLREEKGKEGLKELSDEVFEKYGIAPKEPENDLAGSDEKKNEYFLQTKKELIKSVEKIAKRAEEVMKGYQDQMTGNEYHEIKIRVDNLMRLRLSNNLKYIQDLADELLDLIDKAQQEHGGTEVSEEGGIRGEKEEREKQEVNVEDYYLRSKNAGTTSRLGKLSERLAKALGKKQKHREEKPQGFLQTNPAAIRTKLIIHSTRKIFRTIRRIIFTKSNAARKEHLHSLVETFQELSDVVSASRAKLIAKGEKMNAEQEETMKEEENKKKEEQRDYHINLSYRFFRELRLFFGWLLAFYVSFFYITVFALVKWGNESSFYDFLWRSVTSSFPFMITGSVFLIFAGLTIHVRLSHGKILGYSFGSLVTIGLVVLFLVNF